MAIVTSEFEVASSFPVSRVFKVFGDFDTIAPKADPQTYKSIETIHGDGGVGTIKVITFGDGIPLTSAKQRVDAVDTSNFSVSYTIIEGDVLADVLDSVTHHVKFVPSADGGSIYKHTMIYNCKGDAKPSDDELNFAKEAYTKAFKDLEAYAVAHPETY